MYKSPYNPKVNKPHDKPLRDPVNILIDHAQQAIENEQKAQSRRLSWILRKQAEELDREHEWIVNNQCPHCHVALTALGECSFDCGYIKPKTPKCFSCLYRDPETCVCLNKDGRVGHPVVVKTSDECCKNYVRS